MALHRGRGPSSRCVRMFLSCNGASRPGSPAVTSSSPLISTAPKPRITSSVAIVSALEKQIAHGPEVARATTSGQWRRFERSSSRSLASAPAKMRVPARRARIPRQLPGARRRFGMVRRRHRAQRAILRRHDQAALHHASRAQPLTRDIVFVTVCVDASFYQSLAIGAPRQPGPASDKVAELRSSSIRTAPSSRRGETPASRTAGTSTSSWRPSRLAPTGESRQPCISTRTRFLKLGRTASSRTRASRTSSLLAFIARGFSEVADGARPRNDQWSGNDIVSREPRRDRGVHERPSTSTPMASRAWPV